MGYDQKRLVDLQNLNFKCEINVYRFPLGCNHYSYAAKKTKHDIIKPNTHKYQCKIFIINFIYSIYCIFIYS